ncbi:nuclear transport factor 2 family protein [Olleya sp. HaHaR_3_96]|uniref:nuclear transport factor 2 family protein n=1 Tax=Olleya sp. HaHaR_3_96 TaxID=2745560 RepID=UPI0039831C3B
MFFYSCQSKQVRLDANVVKQDINTNIEAWHKAASEADFDRYFGLMTKDGVFIGTDASENWQLNEFKAYAKPHFDKGKAWSFTTLERTIYLDSSRKIAWFDELLDTQMEICRGSGVVENVEGQWKIKHYVLSMTFPNDRVSEVIGVKKEADSITKTVLLK